MTLLLLVLLVVVALGWDFFEEDEGREGDDEGEQQQQEQEEDEAMYDEMLGGDVELEIGRSNQFANEGAFVCANCMAPVADYDQLLRFDTREAVGQFNMTVWTARPPLLLQLLANPANQQFDVFTVHRSRLRRSSTPVLEASWWPGYTVRPLACSCAPCVVETSEAQWTIGTCGCGAHLGWIFDKTPSFSVRTTRAQEIYCCCFGLGGRRRRWSFGSSATRACSRAVCRALASRRSRRSSTTTCTFSTTFSKLLRQSALPEPSFCSALFFC